MSEFVEKSDPLKECPKFPVTFTYEKMREFVSKLEFVILWDFLESGIVYYCHEKSIFGKT